jgi:hypothetical protein
MHRISRFVARRAVVDGCRPGKSRIISQQAGFFQRKLDSFAGGWFLVESRYLV